MGILMHFSILKKSHSDARCRRLVRGLAFAAVSLLMIYLTACSTARTNVGLSERETTAQRIDYRIASGDILIVRFYYHPELNTEAWVRPDGYISLDLVGDIEAAGQKPATLDSLLEALYRKELIDPKIAVMVKRSANQKVYVGGEVESPGMIPIDGELNVMSAIIQVGGLKPSAKISEVAILRNDARKGPITLKLDLRNITRGKASEANIALQPYDVVYVPKTGIARANDFVDAYIEGLLPVSTVSGFAWLYALLRDN
jgi:protein involved in polysaccharide export with SLBB domain